MREEIHGCAETITNKQNRHKEKVVKPGCAAGLKKKKEHKSIDKSKGKNIQTLNSSRQLGRSTNGFSLGQRTLPNRCFADPYPRPNTSACPHG